MSIAFEKAKKTFLGFLEARGKALNTIKNYSCDLSELGAFCEERRLDFLRLGLPELEAYHKALRKRGLRPNSRRRKLITAKTFLRYLSGRVDLATVGFERIIPPEKVEKPPRLVPREAVLAIAREQPDTDPGRRNRALLGVLLDTGMLVTEALALRPADFAATEGGGMLAITGKRARGVAVAKETAAAIHRLLDGLSGARYLFYGYSSSSRNAEKLTARGVELLFKGWAKARGLERFHPRTLRHLFVVDALATGRTKAEIMACLGLRTPYAFRQYHSLLNPASEPHVPQITSGRLRAAVHDGQEIKERGGAEQEKT